MFRTRWLRVIKDLRITLVPDSYGQNGMHTSRNSNTPDAGDANHSFVEVSIRFDAVRSI